MTTATSILDLPVDILFLLFPYLDAPSFLNLTSTCRALHNPQFLHDHRYWCRLVRTTFRVPNQPVVQNDGERWQKLFKRLLTQSKIYTWGDNANSCLGHNDDDLPRALQSAETPGDRRIILVRSRHVSWPGKMREVEGMGVVSDLQCGGWSTSMLTSKGAVYTVGKIDGLQHGRIAYVQPTAHVPEPLAYPPGFVPPQQRYDAATAIKQFSSGRAHVLGLSDSGRIWSWQNIEHAALEVRFLNHDTMQSGRRSGRGTVKKVVAGWNKSAALIEGTGIVIWEPLRRGHPLTEGEDAALVLESALVPNTNFRQSSSKPRSDIGTVSAEMEDRVGEVLNFIVLDEVLLFNTHLGKAFVAQIHWSNDEQRVGEPIELQLGNREEEVEVGDTPQTVVHATDVQGSFRSFAVFTRSGEVLTSNQDRLMDLIHDQLLGKPLFTRIPALQDKGVISVAFGDYHFHALHASGYITSYGNEPQACGALGLGGHGDPEGRLRGVRYQGIGGDGRLVPHAYSAGRSVWFEEEKQQWIRFLTAGGADPAEAAERMRMALGSAGVHCQGEVSEWIEQQGRDWESKFGVRASDDDGLGAYFALSVTAAGWHSGALVLVNDDLARRVKDACEVPDPTAEEADEPKENKDDSDQQRDADRDEGDESSEVTTTPAAPSIPATSPSIQQQTFLAFFILLALDYGRWFLGMAPYNAPPRSGYQPSAVHGALMRPGATPRFQRNADPRNFGQSPREGFRYIWANDHFPRLRLSNGTEMPGNVAFDEWRYDRPDFNLDAGV